MGSFGSGGSIPIQLCPPHFRHPQRTIPHPPGMLRPDSPLGIPQMCN
jgi:hypothetical protein